MEIVSLCLGPVGSLIHPKVNGVLHTLTLLPVSPVSSVLLVDVMRLSVSPHPAVVSLTLWLYRDWGSLIFYHYY